MIFLTKADAEAELDMNEAVQKCGPTVTHHYCCRGLGAEFPPADADDGRYVPPRYVITEDKISERFKVTKTVEQKTV